MNDEASGIYEYTFIGKANSKFFQQNFTLSRAARVDANPQSILFTAYRLSFYVFQENFQVLSFDFQLCVSENNGYMHSLKCELIAKKTAGDLFLQSFENVNFSGKNFKFAVLIKCYHRSWFILFKRQRFYNQEYTLDSQLVSDI